MRLCNVCGNEIEDEEWKCPFCGTHVAGPASCSRRRVRQVVSVNLKSDLPTVDEAIRRLGVKLEAARSANAKIVRVIHGWGSTGSGGKIKDASHRYLRRLKSRGRIKGFVAGEAYSELSARGRELLKAHPTLKRSLRSDRLNQGITLVELQSERPHQ